MVERSVVAGCLFPKGSFLDQRCLGPPLSCGSVVESDGEGVQRHAGCDVHSPGRSGGDMMVMALSMINGVSDERLKRTWGDRSHDPSPYHAGEKWRWTGRLGAAMRCWRMTRRPGRRGPRDRPASGTAGAMPTCSRSFGRVRRSRGIRRLGQIGTVARGDRRAHRVGRLGAAVAPGRVGDSDQRQALDGFPARGREPPGARRISASAVVRSGQVLRTLLAESDI